MKQKHSHEEQTTSVPAPSKKMTSEQAAAGEQLQVDLMDFRKGVMARLPGHLGVRVPLLIGLLVALMSWLQRHWQVPISGMLGGAGVLAAYPYALPFLQKKFKEHRVVIEQTVTQITVRYLAFLLSTPVLAGLFAVTLIPNLFFSSVTVVAAEGPIRLQTIEGGEIRPNGAAWDAVRSLVGAGSDVPGRKATVFSTYTSPLGRTLTLTIAGYEELTFKLYPGLGQQIDPSTSQQLKRSPAIVLRLPPEAYDVDQEIQAEENQKGELKLFRRIRDNGVLVLELVGESPTRPMHGAYVFGWLPGAVADLGTTWDADLEANAAYTQATELKRVAPKRYPTVKWLWGNAVRREFLPGKGPVPGEVLEAYFLLDRDRGIESVTGYASLVVIESEKSVQDQMLSWLSDTQVKSMRESPELSAAMPPLGAGSTAPRGESE